MIIISGLVNSSKEDLKLPVGIVVKIVNEIKPLSLLLKTVGKRPDCVGVYLLKDTKYSLLDIPLEVQPKIHMFNSEDDLIKLLESTYSNTKTPDNSSEVLKNDEKVLENSVDEEVKATQSLPLNTLCEDLQETDTDLPVDVTADDIILSISSSESALKNQLQSKDEIIAQKDCMIAELHQELDNFCADHENNLKGISEKLKSAQETVEKYNSSCLRCIEPFISHPKAKISSSGVIDNTIKSPIYTIAMNTQTELIRFARSFNEIFKDEHCVILDLTNDYLIPIVLGVKKPKEHSSLDLITQAKSVKESSLVKDNKVLFLSEIFNDIALLNADWNKILKELSDVTNGLPIYILLGSIKSFSVSYALTELTLFGKSGVIAQGSPVSLQTLYGSACFITNDVGFIVYDYADASKVLIEQIHKNHDMGVLKLNSFSDELLKKAIHKVLKGVKKGDEGACQS